MSKEILKNILNVIIFILVYLLQIYVINNVSFFGVNGNLCLVVVMLVTLMKKDKVTYIVAGICGIVSDILFSDIICRYFVIYIIVTTVLIGLKKMYKQDSKIAIIVFSIVAVVINEMLMFVFNIMEYGAIVNIFSFLLAVIKSCIINVCLAFLIYLVFRMVNKEG